MVLQRLFTKETSDTDCPTQYTRNQGFQDDHPINSNNTLELENGGFS